MVKEIDAYRISAVMWNCCKDFGILTVEDSEIHINSPKESASCTCSAVLMSGSCESFLVGILALHHISGKQVVVHYGGSPKEEFLIEKERCDFDSNVDVRWNVCEKIPVIPGILRWENDLV